MIEVSVSIPASLRTALDPAQYARALDATVNAAAESLRNRIAVYPGKSHSPVIWASEKSRRYYFAMRRQGGLPPNYTRNSDPMSQRLGPGWAVRKQGTAEYIVGNKSTYATWVQSAAQQSPQHKATGWKTDEQAVDELNRSGDIERAGKQAMSKITGVT
jgi:hypothetical protein